MTPQTSLTPGSLCFHVAPQPRLFHKPVPARYRWVSPPIMDKLLQNPLYCSNLVCDLVDQRVVPPRGLGTSAFPLRNHHGPRFSFLQMMAVGRPGIDRTSVPQPVLTCRDRRSRLVFYPRPPGALPPQAVFSAFAAWAISPDPDGRTTLVEKSPPGPGCMH